MTIIEVIIALVALAIMSTTIIKDDIAKHRTAIFTAEGQNEQVINAALGTYQTINTAALLAGTPVSGFANPMAPQLSELSAAKILKAVYNPKTFWGATYETQISVVPAGCSVAAGTCHLSSVLYPSTPLTRNGSADVEGAGEIALAGGNLFGFSSKQNPGTVTGINGAFATPNPLPGTPAAAIVAINGYGTDGTDVYIRRDGGSTWTGNQDVNGVNLDNAGTINAQEINVQNGSGVESTVLGSAEVNHYDAIDQLYMQSNNGTVVMNTAGTAFAPLYAGATAISGPLNVSGAVNLGTPTGACQVGQVAMAASVMYVCSQSGVYVNAGHMIGNVYTVQKYLAQGDGAAIPKPTCVGGTSTATIIQQTVGINVAVNPPIETNIPTLTDEGSYWLVNLKLQDSSGNQTSGNTQGLTAEIDAQCVYGNE